jgi:dihydroorotate dehydrogenase electron transfer subunit
LCRYFEAEIISNDPAGRQFRMLDIKPACVIVPPRPGQFYMLQAGRTEDPLIKRPFSLLDIRDGRLRFLYRVRGKGTMSLAGFRAGEMIRVIGPLGNGFPEPKGEFIVAAGGIGIASVYSLLEKNRGKAILFYGVRNSDELVMAKEASALSKETFIASDDGSAGKKGLITSVLADFMGSSGERLPVYACGPAPMLRALHGIVSPKGVKCYVSMEEHMACGVGACLGCVVKVRSQPTVGGSPESAVSSQKWIYKRVCKEGPIFDIEDIIWE